MVNDVDSQRAHSMRALLRNKDLISVIQRGNEGPAEHPDASSYRPYLSVDARLYTPTHHIS